MTGEERMQGWQYVSMGVKEEGELRPNAMQVRSPLDEEEDRVL